MSIIISVNQVMCLGDQERYLGSLLVLSPISPMWWTSIKEPFEWVGSFKKVHPIRRWIWKGIFNYFKGGGSKLFNKNKGVVYGGHKNELKNDRKSDCSCFFLMHEYQIGGNCETKHWIIFLGKYWEHARDKKTFCLKQKALVIISFYNDSNQILFCYYE